MSKLDVSCWVKFRIGDLFDIHPTTAYKMTNIDLYKIPGNVPVLSNSSANNGIAGYSGLAPTEAGNIITFSDTTTGTDTIFYQKHPFIGYPHVQGMYPRDESLKSAMNERVALFLIPVMQRTFGSDWSYGNKFTRKIVMETCILLPATAQHIPDWEYMQERIAELEQEYIAALEHKRTVELKKHLTAAGLNEYVLTEEDAGILSLSDSQHNREIKPAAAHGATKIMKRFRMGDLFTFETGDVDLQQKDINGKGCYLINSGLGNCGIKGMTDRPAKIFPANTITIDFWGNAFYRDFPYKMATHNHVFSLSGEVIQNGDVGLYLVSRMSYFKTLFSFTNMGTCTKISALTILLPVQTNAEGQPVAAQNHLFHPDGYIPDWNYMAAYTRVIKKLVIADVVHSRDKKIEAARAAIFAEKEA